MDICVDSENNVEWVFGYGSLMWRPGFDYIAARPARVFGFHRSFCVYSHVHRGTPERPGLVFGLDRGGSCRGLAFQVPAGKFAGVRDYLRAREQVTMVYEETRLPVHLGDSGGVRRALCYTVDRSHVQYAGKLSFDEQVRLISKGVGQSGANPDYLFDMAAHLRDMDIRDEPIERLHSAVSETLRRSA